MSGVLYILTGASGCGKTTLLNALKKNGTWFMASKYSERAIRNEDDDIVSVSNIEDICDVIYEINGVKYGISLDKIRSELSFGKSIVVILSDFRVVRKIKNTFGDQVKAIYISSAIDEKKLRTIQMERIPLNPTHSQRLALTASIRKLNFASINRDWDDVVRIMGELSEAWEDALPESKSYDVRTRKIRLFHSRYIDNIPLFDHVILNYYTLQDMIDQAVNIVASDSKTRIKEKKQTPVIFMVSAASGADKGTLMESLNIMGSDQIIVVNKKAKRDPKPSDRRDGMTAIGKDGIFPDEYDWRWTFHLNDLGIPLTKVSG